MLEGSMSAPLSLFAAVNSWLTPMVLFLFLNLTIGTILFTSRHSNNGPRSRSILHRIKSVSFNAYRSQAPENFPDSDTHFDLPPVTTEQIESSPPLSRSPSMLHRLKSINLQNYFSQEPTSPVKSPEANSQEQTLEEVYSQVQTATTTTTTHFARTKSDTDPTAGEIPTKLTRKMRKSASTKSAFAHFEEEDVVEIRRPATVRETGTVKDSGDLDEEVDAKADDFIYRFKEQLKLQRVNSIIRYKEMIGRGS